MTARTKWEKEGNSGDHVYIEARDPFRNGMNGEGRISKVASKLADKPRSQAGTGIHLKSVGHYSSREPPFSLRAANGVGAGHVLEALVGDGSSRHERA